VAISNEVSIDTLQGHMANRPDVQIFVATINGVKREIGFVEQLAGDVRNLEIGGITYAIRLLFIWRELGSDTLTMPFSAVAYSSVEHAFVVLNEGLQHDTSWGSIVVEAVRYASSEEIERGLYKCEDDVLEQSLRSWGVC
jgi:hypothetical protein